jgi:hypothetical protein
MRKDGSKRRYIEKRSGMNSRIVFFIIFLVLLSGIGIGVYQYRKEHSTIVSTYFASLTNWFAERKNHLHQGMGKTKQLSEAKEAQPEQIHFEFYTTLPNMQIKPKEINPAQSNKRESKQ